MVWFVVNKKRGKQESLNHYRIITNIADQNALQEQPQNNHKVGSLERQCNSAMNCSALSNVDYEQPKQKKCHLTYICCLPAFTDENCGENIMVRAKLGQVKIRHTLLHAECLSSRVAVNTESIQYEFMTRVDRKSVV